MKKTTRTRTIAGHTITLVRGERYLAARPMASSENRKTYPVTIYKITDGWSVNQKGIVRIDGLTYDQSNELLVAFNNGPTSFDGRKWN